MKTTEDKITNALIIDDDIDTCVLLGRILIENKIKSLSVNTLYDAEKLFESVHPRLIFLDNNLPDGYGLNFITNIRDKFPDTQIVMITAHSTEFNRRTARLRGAGFFIEKPFSSIDIVNVLDSISRNYNDNPNSDQ